MKKLLYLFIALFVVLSVHSCKRLSDTDGDLLNDVNANQGGLTGARFLYQEVNSVDTIAEYHYTGKKLTEVVGKNSLTKLIYNGDLVNKMTYNALVGADSIAYTQYFTYDATAKQINSISEIKTVYTNVHATVPGPIEKYKSLYTISYNSLDIINNVVKITGKEVTGQVFAFTTYDKMTYTYDSKTNVSQYKKEAGTYTAGVYGTPMFNYSLAFTKYDDSINPHTLLPFAYKLSHSFLDGGASYRFSPNNPKTISITTDPTMPPNVISTLYTYDAQNYALAGLGVNYDYRPF